MNIYFQGANQRAFGTFPLKGDEARQAIQTAAEAGYRAFDTAQMYGNEAETGEALKATGIPRDDLCITTKVHPDNFDIMDFTLSSVDMARIDKLTHTNHRIVTKNLVPRLGLLAWPHHLSATAFVKIHGMPPSSSYRGPV